jgi:hypothetical protein
MPVYQIHRMRDHVRASFRSSPHTSGTAAVKARDFLPETTPVEAVSPYAAWQKLLGTGEALVVGDLLEDEAGRLFLCKYVGFEKAEWVQPEVVVMGQVAAGQAAGSPPV